ncbi:Nitroreductase-like protein [Mrakia frigida]|uniref:Nitroreductase-like protein n=1 Tax=Mrakia frigida TaxID=29902 RepID=UPI003FCC0F16
MRPFKSHLLFSSTSHSPSTMFSTSYSSYVYLLPILPILLAIYLLHQRSSTSKRSLLSLFTSSSPSPHETCHTYLSSIVNRRSIYVFSQGLPKGVDQAKIQEVVQNAVKYSPASFNAESARVVVLWGAESRRVWELVWNGIEGAANFPDEAARAKSKLKVDQLAAGSGTVLFFEDQVIVDKFSDYPTHFEQSSGMLQFNIWTALSTLKVGASLHHYSNLIEADIHKIYELPSSWVLKGEMPFGSIGAPAGYKLKSYEGRVKVFGGDAEKMV